MPTAAKNNFELHIEECAEAISVYRHLEKSGYKAGFGLRFVWIAAVSALDHYVTELIIEVATERFANKTPLEAKLLNEKMAFSHVQAMADSNSINALLAFRVALSEAIKYKSFQNADAISDGLSYVWSEPHKWQKIATNIGIPMSEAREKINNVVARRNLIAHNADVDDALNKRKEAKIEDAEEVISFVRNLVGAIDLLVL